MIRTLKEREKLFENKRFLALDGFMKNAQTKAQESFAVIKCEPSWEEPLMVFETAPDYIKDVDLALIELAEIKKVVEYWFIKSLTKHGELAMLINTTTGVTENPVDIIERLKAELSKPTLDDAIAVVERYRDEQYKKWSDTFPNWAKYEDTPLMEHDLYYHAEGILNSIHNELTALRGLK